MRLALIGYGGVGKALVKLLYSKRYALLNENLDCKVNYIIASKGGVYEPQGINLEDVIRYTEENHSIAGYPYGYREDISFDTMLSNKDVDMVIEMTPTDIADGEPGMTHIKKSLENGLHVVTANKGPILLSYKSLKSIADNRNVRLGIGCTTGGALPSVNGGVMDMAGSEITSIEGVLNGTTNFILDEMELNGVEYKIALEKAQSLGIAEADTTLDVEGWDTATKLLILTNVLMNEEKTMDDISVEGITSIKASDIKEALSEGKRYKLVGRAIREGNGLSIRVGPEKVGRDNLLYGVSGKNKAVKYKSDTLGDLVIIGGASGVTPAAASILRDIVNIHRGYRF